MVDDEIFEHITIEPKSIYPVAGGIGKENLFIINYKLFGIVKSFEAKSNKELLTIDDIQLFILEHEMRDYIKNTKCETNTKRPPIGITPHFIWIEQRIEEIKQGINRRIEAKVIIPPQWYTELAQLENEKNKTQPYIVSTNVQLTEEDILEMQRIATLNDYFHRGK
jgi:hypothetical protein